MVRWDSLIERVPLGPRMGAEVGVHCGETSDHLLRARPELILYMIDPWEELTGPGLDPRKYTPRGCARALTAARQVSRKHGNRGVIMRMPSLVAVTKFDSASLDFVFIDALHTYEAVFSDIVAWLPKIKSGGFVSGHDYGSPKYPGVERAVRAALPRANIETGADYTWFATLP